MADILTDRLKRNRDGTIRDDLVSKMAKGLKRIHEKFPLPEASLRDLLSCIKLIGDNNPIPFHWDTPSTAKLMLGLLHYPLPRVFPLIDYQNLAWMKGQR